MTRSIGVYIQYFKTVSIHCHQTNPVKGLVLGVVGCVPLVMNTMGVNMEQQAIFSMAMVPFSVKILWAPIVDSISFGKLGWRKPWIVFAQSIVGALLACASLSFNTLVEVDLGFELGVFSRYFRMGI